MAKHRNHVIYDRDPARLSKLAEDYSFLGREVIRKKDRLIVLALPTHSKRKDRLEKKRRDNKRAREDY